MPAYTYTCASCGRAVKMLTLCPVCESDPPGPSIEDQYPGIAPCPGCGETDQIVLVDAHDPPRGGPCFAACLRCDLVTDTVLGEGAAVAEWEAGRIEPILPSSDLPTADPA